MGGYGPQLTLDSRNGRKTGDFDRYAKIPMAACGNRETVTYELISCLSVKTERNVLRSETSSHDIPRRTRFMRQAHCALRSDVRSDDPPTDPDGSILWSHRITHRHTRAPVTLGAISGSNGTARAELWSEKGQDSNAVTAVTAVRAGLLCLHGRLRW
jgi:hypothetical protein